jgi:hypothetical protein
MGMRMGMGSGTGGVGLWSLNRIATEVWMQGKQNTWEGIGVCVVGLPLPPTGIRSSKRQ